MKHAGRESVCVYGCIQKGVCVCVYIYIHIYVYIYIQIDRYVNVVSYEPRMFAASFPTTSEFGSL